MPPIHALACCSIDSLSDPTETRTKPMSSSVSMAFASRTTLEYDCSRASNMTRVGAFCSNLARAWPRSIFHSWSYLRYWSSCLLTRPSVRSYSRAVSVISPRSSGSLETSEKKEKSSGSSSGPPMGCGGVSLHVPSIQRTKARLDSTIERTSLARTLLTSANGGERRTSGAARTAPRP